MVLTLYVVLASGSPSVNLLAKLVVVTMPLNQFATFSAKFFRAFRLFVANFRASVTKSTAYLGIALITAFEFYTLKVAYQSKG